MGVMDIGRRPSTLNDPVHDAVPVGVGDEIQMTLRFVALPTEMYWPRERDDERWP
jgi:hypothetical protein